MAARRRDYCTAQNRRTRMSAARSWEGLISRPQILLYAGAPNEFLPPCLHEKVFVDFPLGGGHEIETGAVGIAARPVEVVEKPEGGTVRHAIARRWNLDAAKIAAGVSRIGRGIARIKNVVGHDDLLFCSALFAFADGAKDGFTGGAFEVNGVTRIIVRVDFTIRKKLEQIKEIFRIDQRKTHAKVIR